MKIILFDAILESHVVQALLRALDNRGYEVIETGKVWRGHVPPVAVADVEMIDRLVVKLSNSGADVLFNFRACTLLPHHIDMLRRNGVRTIVWLPDDPVLYAVNYKDIVDLYDVVLHCGGEDVLRYYDQKGHKKGINFPFWVDPLQYQYRYLKGFVGGKDIVFLGNVSGGVRMSRYEMLSPLSDRLDIWGKVDSE